MNTQSTSPSELVSCIRREDWYQSTRGVGLFQDSYLENLLQDTTRLLLLPRPACEAMVEFKQVIPYVGLTHGTGENLRIVIYQRGKGCGEARLHSKWSIGFGGHCNLTKETLLDAVDRELLEELDISRNAGRLTYRGLLNLERTPVDRVHLGVSYTLKLGSAMSLHRHDHPDQEQETRISWQPYYHVAAMRESLEPWSQLLLDNILQEHGLQ